MRINNFISINQEDLSPLHNEIVSIYDSFVLSAKDTEEAKAHERLFKQEYPTIMRLKNLIESILIGQQNLSNYERIGVPSSKPPKTNKFKLVKNPEVTS